MDWLKKRKQLKVTYSDKNSITYTIKSGTAWKPYFERHIMDARRGRVIEMTLRAYPFKDNKPIDLIKADAEGRIDKL